MRNKRLIVIFALLISLSVFQFGCPPPTQPVYIGIWEKSSLTEAIIFHTDGTFESLYLYRYDPALQWGQPIPPVPTDNNTWKQETTGTYTIDLSKNPPWIDLTINGQGTEQGQSRREQGLITFLNNDTFNLALGDARPASIGNSFTRFNRATPNEISPISK